MNGGALNTRAILPPRAEQEMAAVNLLMHLILSEERHLKPKMIKSAEFRAKLLDAGGSGGLWRLETVGLVFFLCANTTGMRSNRKTVICAVPGEKASPGSCRCRLHQ